MRPLILASASPRRLELLQNCGLSPRVIVSAIDETKHAGESSLAYARRVAEDKAAAVEQQVGDANAVILAADTIVVVDDHTLGKPVDRADAARMLALIDHRAHAVVTAYHMRAGDTIIARHVTTDVWVRALDAAEREAYLDTNEWADKAGGYAIQGFFSAFIERISGSYANVVGLPVAEVIADLRELGAIAPNWLATR